jgi:hypothetical protein
LGAFTAALGGRQFSRPDKNPLGAGTVKETVAKLDQIFRANVGYNPTHGSADNGMHPSLARQIKGMKNKDPGEKKQKALPVCVYREIYKQAMSPSADPQDVTIAWLQVLAFFFCDRVSILKQEEKERLKWFVSEISDFTNRRNSSARTHRNYPRQRLSP